MLSKEEIDRLEVLARAATPGPWTLTDEGDELRAGKESIISGSNDNEGYFGHSPDGEFCAATNPAVVLELIEMLRAKEADHVQA